MTELQVYSGVCAACYEGSGAGGRGVWRLCRLAGAGTSRGQATDRVLVPGDMAHILDFSVDPVRLPQ